MERRTKMKTEILDTTLERQLTVFSGLAGGLDLRRFFGHGSGGGTFLTDQILMGDSVVYFVARGDS